jgi:hypothetical protein
VYADWLEERGDQRAEYLRVEATLAVDGQVPGERELRQRLDELRKIVDPRWQALLDRTLLENCGPQFRGRCPKRWERLETTHSDTTRWCRSCRRMVYYCGTIEEARERTRRGRRIAVNSHEERSPGDLGDNLLASINRTVREYEFLPVDGATLDQPMRGHFERLTPALLALDFQPIGTFRMKPEPLVVHNRIFLSADGRTLSNICCVLRAGTISFMSVLDDGTCVHTVGSRNPHPERTLEPADRLLLTYLPDTDPIDRHREHQEILRAGGARAGAEPMQFQPNQFKEVMVYDQCLFNRWRWRHGDLYRRPPVADFATLQCPAVQ